MILELGNGRELKLPDMDDETARQIGKLILATEKRAADAEAGMAKLRREVAELKQQVEAPEPETDDNEGENVVAAIEAMEQRLTALLQRSIALQGADRILVNDETGTPRSRVVLKG